MINVTDRLDEALEEQYAGAYTAAYDDENREAWSVTDQDRAAWASRKLNKAHAHVQAVSEWEAREIERIKAVAESERKRYTSEIEFFEGHLAQYLIRLVAEGRKTKSLDLPGGKIQLRARQPRLEIVDEVAAIKWLRIAGKDNFIRVKETVDKAQLKKAVAAAEGKGVFLETGELIDGITVEERPDSISFTPASEGVEGES